MIERLRERAAEGNQLEKRIVACMTNEINRIRQNRTKTEGIIEMGSTRVRVPLLTRRFTRSLM